MRTDEHDPRPEGDLAGDEQTISDASQEPTSAAGDAAEGSDTEIAPESWAEWCRRATDENTGRSVLLRFRDEALGEVRLAEGQVFIGLEHDQLGASVALSVKYGDGVVPVRHVIVDPREVRQHEDASGTLDEVTVLDGTGRRTIMSLS